MALKRLDEEFDLKPGTQLLPYMKRLLPTLENRFQDLEATDDTLQALADDIRKAAVSRMNEILIPATEDIIAITKLGFLLAPVTEMQYDLQLGFMAVYVDDGPQAKSFTPSPYIIVEGMADPNNYALAKTIAYDPKLRIFEMEVTAVHGDTRAQDWMLTSTPGMAQSAKDYHDVISPMHTEVRSDTIEVRGLHEDIMSALEALEGAGLDLYNYVRYDGTTPFRAVQGGVAPPTSSADASLVTSAWARARIQEYVAGSVAKTGDTMSGHLTLAGEPTQPSHAATKKYIDDLLGGAGGALTITTVNPSIRLQVTGSQQDRTFEGLGVGGVQRWSMVLGNDVPEVGGNAGSDFNIRRYSDAGVPIDVPMQISRATGELIIKNSTVEGWFDVKGDIHTYRPNLPNTGVVYLNQARNAYHYFDGTNHSMQGGGLTVGGNISGNHLNVLSISTQGHGLTTWGLTSHGHAQINSSMTVNGGEVEFTGISYNMLRFWDNNWGMMYLHHQDNNIGFLNNGAGWVWYINNDGHMWISQYGWLHDYVNGRANAYAWDAANYRYNQCVTTTRFAHIGDVQHYYSTMQEPWGGCAITGITGCYSGYYINGRYRQLHMLIAGGWYAAGY